MPLWTGSSYRTTQKAINSSSRVLHRGNLSDMQHLIFQWFLIYHWDIPSSSCRNGTGLVLAASPGAQGCYCIQNLTSRALQEPIKSRQLNYMLWNKTYWNIVLNKTYNLLCHLCIISLHISSP